MQISKQSITGLRPQASRLCRTQLHVASSSRVSVPTARKCSSDQSLSPCKQAPLTRQAACQATRPAVFFFGNNSYDDDDEEEFTVCKVTVGMFGNIRRFQLLLEKMSDGYNDDDEDSLHGVLQDSLTTLLRNIQFVGYGATAGKVFNQLEDAESKFNSVLMEERSKFREETYVNVGGRKKIRAATELGSGNGLDEWLAVTLVIATEGTVKLPQVRGVADMKKALTLLAGISRDDLVAMELLWTPQAEGDSYSKDELLIDYPALAIVQ